MKTNTTPTSSTTKSTGSNLASTLTPREQRRFLLLAVLVTCLLQVLYQQTTTSVPLTAFADQQRAASAAALDTILSSKHTKQDGDDNDVATATASATTLSSSLTYVPLTQLVATDQATSCPAPLVRYNDTVLDAGLAYAGGRRIPRILHLTSKSRCLMPDHVGYLAQWKDRLPDHSIFLHDDDAVARLLSDRHWPDFPDVHHVMDACLISGAAKADLWRAVVLYEYGGIYTDIDNHPNKFNGTTIAVDDQAFFVVEKLGVLSQYFMAAEPKHPLMYLLVKQILTRVLQLPNVKKQFPAVLTGPGALKTAMIEFMNKLHLQEPKAVYDPDGTGHGTFQRVRAGRYQGHIPNATVTVVGLKEWQNEYVARDRYKGKMDSYAAMNMTHFSKTAKPGLDESCVHRIYRRIVAPRLDSIRHDEQLMRPLW